MASLTGQTIASTYDSLLKVTDNEPLTSSLKAVTDGLGNTSALQLSTSAVNVTGNITASNLSGTNTGDETQSSIKSKLGAASSSQDGYLTSTDWNTFNNKQNALTNPITGTGTSGYHLKFTGSTTVANGLIYDSGSAIGIGTATPNTKLEVYNENTSTIRISNQISYANLIHSGNNTVVQSPENFIIDIGGEKARFTATGLGIGTSSPGQALDVNGNARATSFIKTGGTSSQFLKADGSVDSTSYTPSSRILTINGTAYDLSADRSWSVGTISGTGTAGRVARFLDSTTLTNTSIYIAFDETIGEMVGIGGDPNSSPAYPNKLYVAGTSYFTDSITSNGNGTFAGNVRSLRSWIGPSSFTSFTAPLHVQQATLLSNPIARFKNSNTDNSSELTSLWLENGAGFRGEVYYTSHLDSNRLILNNSSASGTIQFSIGGSERMRITSGGNVGIGTSSPDNGRLTIESTSVGNPANALIIRNSGSTVIGTESRLFLSTVSGDNRGAYISSIITSASNDNALTFATNSAGSSPTERMRITSGGNVGIGTSSPAEKLHVYANSGTSFAIQDTGGVLRLVTASGANYIQSGLALTGGSSAPIIFGSIYGVNEWMRITSSGDVLINKTGLSAASVGVEFERNSSARMTTDGNTVLLLNRLSSDGTLVDIRRSGTQVGSISVTTMGTSYNIVSDYRLKQDFKDYNATELISKINTYDFEWKSSNERMYGVKAHELQEVIPYAVTGEKDAEEMQQVDYSKLVPVLVKAIQEQQAQIEELKTKLN